MKCPYCGSADVDFPTIDIGVGEQQCGPAGCFDCGAAQLYPDDKPRDDDEKRTGWSRGGGPGLKED